MRAHNFTKTLQKLQPHFFLTPHIFFLTPFLMLREVDQNFLKTSGTWDGEKLFENLGNLERGKTFWKPREPGEGGRAPSPRPRRLNKYTDHFCFLINFTVVFLFPTQSNDFLFDYKKKTSAAFISWLNRNFFTLFYCKFPLYCFSPFFLSALKNLCF